MANTKTTPATPANSRGTKKRLLLLDGHSLAYRAFFALKDANLVTTTGQHTEGVYGFTSMLIKVLDEEQPTHIAACFDRAEPTFRHETFVDYKANRIETPEDFRGQIDLIFEVLDALRVPRLSKPGFEADDLIATLATQAAQAMDVLIVTGDRDALQLVDDHITVLMTRVGITNMTRFTPDAVMEKYGLSPRQYPDFAALRGDPSDNLPNIPGIGEKTATKWIAEYGSLEELVNRVDEVKGKVGDKLRDHVAQVLRNRQLTELLRDVEMDVSPQDLIMGQWDRDEVHKLFDTLQFRVLRERLYELSSSTPAADEGFTVETAVLSPGDVAQWLAEHTSDGRSGLAFRGTWARGTGDLDAIAIAAPDGTAAVVDLSTVTPEDERAIGAWLADESRPKAVHDAKGPMLALWERGFDLKGVTGDTAVEAYLALPGQRAFDLADLALRYLRRELRAEDEGDGQLALDDQGERDLALRAYATAGLADALEKDLEGRGATRLLKEVELPLVEVLAEMERVGIGADSEHFATMSAELGADVKAAEEGAFEVVGHEFNLGSPKQLQQVLFTELGLPKTKRIKSGYTTDSDALKKLLADTGHPVLEHLMRHREVSKLKSMVDSLIPMVDDHGRIHTTLSQTVAATGRLSSNDPNLQNIPIRTPEGRRIRAGFVVGEGCECLLTADYSQIELRIMADLSGDESLNESFGSGYDFHAATAAKVFGLPPDQIDGGLRSRIKAMNYGLAYGLSDYGLSGQLGVPVSEARELMKDYFEVFGGVRDFLRDIVAKARHDGYTETIMGRRRYLPDLTSDNRQRREMAERMALNAPIQGSAADIIKVAMLNVRRALQREGLRSKMLLQVHDELIFDVAPGELEDLRTLVTEQMSRAYELRVPLEVSIGTGRTWEEAGH